MKITKEVIEFEKQFNGQEKEIMVITGASGFGGGKVPKEEYWTASISIVAWKEVCNSTLHVEECRLVTKADDEKLKDLREKIKQDSIVSLRASKEGNRFLLLEILETKVRDTELEKFLLEQKKIITYEDNILGTFVLDRQVNWFEAEVEWVGNKIRVSFDKEECMDRAINVMHILFKDQGLWDEKVRQFAADKLLELKNDNWLDEEEESITLEEFMKRITLESISVSPDGDFEFWYDDDDIFWGHCITVEGNIDGGLVDANIQG